MSATILKTGFSLAIIIAIITLLQTTAALDAILLFAAAGIVPGTDIKLTPTATIWTLAGVATLSILLIFSANIARAIRSWRSIRHARAEAKHMIAAVEAPEPLPAAAPVLAPAPISTPAAAVKVSKKEQPRPVVVIKLPGKPGHISHALQALRSAIATSVVLLGEQWPVLKREVVSRTRYAIGVCGLYLAYDWRWLKPRLIKAEKYLDAKLNGHQDITFFIDFLRSASKVLAKWWAEGRTYAISTWRKLSRKIA